MGDTVERTRGGQHAVAGRGGHEVLGGVEVQVSVYPPRVR